MTKASFSFHNGVLDISGDFDPDDLTVDGPIGGPIFGDGSEDEDDSGSDGPIVVGPLPDEIVAPTKIDRWIHYRFHSFFHPYVNELSEALANGGVKGLLTADIKYRRNDDDSIQTLDDDGTPLPQLYEEFFKDTYGPAALVSGGNIRGYPVKDLDFSPSGAYQVYNWELFYHLPLMVAIHLSRNGRYEQAQHWFHYVFDPTDNSDDPEPDRYWKVRPFHGKGAVALIGEVLHNLTSNNDPQLAEDTVHAIDAWAAEPFRPHLVANYRSTAYMLKAVMAYLDNLIAWGDGLFRQDTIESINEATQLYVLAANLLGPRPQEIPRRGRRQPETYASLKAKKLDHFGNAQIDLEVDLPFDTMPAPDTGNQGSFSDAQIASLRSVASPYFCIPRNDKLLGYWDTVADRLFKIRNSLDIHGVFRQLPLFEPPIDPALLARATAAGLDVGAIVAGLHQPLPLVRFGVLVAKAGEICQEVKSLGGHLLSAIEKEDGEELAIIRARHEKVILGLAETIRYSQWQEAIKARESIEKTFGNALARYTHYARQLGKSDAEVRAKIVDLTELGDVDAEALERGKFSSDEPEVALDPIEVDIAQDIRGGRGQIKSSYEAEADRLRDAATNAREAAHSANRTARMFSMIPEFETALKPWGFGAGILIGGKLLSKGMEMVAAEETNRSAGKSEEAAKVATEDTRFRRATDWAFQQNVAAGEITHTYKQWRAAQIREAMAEREWHNHRQQIRRAEEIEQFLTDPKVGKTSSKDLYTWLRREVRGLYSQYFQLAYDIARKAERALQHELGDPGQSFLRFDYQAGKQGLLSGEKLYLDIKRMEMAYHEQNQREYELTKHVSLRQVDPVALLQLRATGTCDFELPEELFDLDGPGHYFRRIRSVALSIPCVAGPYTSVNATLTLQQSAVRTTPTLRDGAYAPEPFGNDSDRYSGHSGQVQSVVTSSGNQDSGLFDVNARDERFLPFEGSGAVSRWRLELPGALPDGLPQFDPDTISDVVLHMRYTAREGGAALRDAAVGHIREQVTGAGNGQDQDGGTAGPGSVRLLSLRHEFPSEWARFRAADLDAETSEAPLAITLREEHYPFWATVFGSLGLRKVELFAEPGPDTQAPITVATAPAGDPARTEQAMATGALGDLLVGALGDPLPEALGELTLHVSDNSITDLWLALTWHAHE